MRDRDTDVLLISDNPGDIRLITEALSGVDNPRFQLRHMDRLDQGLDGHDSVPADVILLDMFLTDGTGLEAVEKTILRASETPVLVLTSLENKTLAIEAVAKGAQDYLVKGSFDPLTLTRSIGHAVKRFQMRGQIRSISLVDLLTGLHNRRGFEVLGERELRLARRQDEELMLIFLVLDGFQQTNERYGHRVGDQVIKEFGSVLSEAFQGLGLMARVGGDEFIVMTRDRGSSDLDEPLNRLEAALTKRNDENDEALRLEASRHATRYKVDVFHGIKDLMAEVDLAMSRQKTQKQASS